MIIIQMIVQNVKKGKQCNVSQISTGGKTTDDDGKYMTVYSLYCMLGGTSCYWEQHEG